MSNDQDEIVDSYPLSPIQEGMLFESLRDAGEPGAPSGMYLMQRVLRLEHELDADRLWQAFERVVERHPILRTRMRWVGAGSPQQEALRTVRLPVCEQDWRSLQAHEQAQRLEEHLIQDRKRGIDLSQAPLFRLALIRLGIRSYDLIFTYHHTISDESSSLQLLDELFQIYEALQLGGELELAQPTPYREYVDWIRGWKCAAESAGAEAYWRAKLGGFGAATRLGLERLEGNAIGSDQRYGACQRSLPDELRIAMTELAQQQGFTLNTIFQGAWAILLSRYSGESEVVFGATRGCRRSALGGKTDHLLGPILNTLPMRARVDGKQRLIPWLQSLRKQWVEMRDFENTPLLQVIAWSDIPPGQPLFRSFCNFSYQSDLSALDSLVKGWGCRSMQIYQAAPYSLVAAMIAAPECKIELAYDRKWFTPAVSEKILGHLHNLLAGMVERPADRLEQLSLMSEVERRQILVEWNATQQDYPKDRQVQQLFEEQVERTPDNLAVVEGWSSDQEPARGGISFQRLANQEEGFRALSYRALNQRANQLAHYLRKLGVGPEAVVGIFMERSLELAIGLLGVLKSGGVYLPLDPDHPAERLAFYLQDSRPKVLLTQSRLRDRLMPGEAHMICMDCDGTLLADESLENPAILTQPKNLAYVIYTSGSTGTPKGVMIQHQSLSDFISFKLSSIPLQPEDRLLQQIPISFDPSIYDFLQPFCSGAQVVLAEPKAHRDIACLVKTIKSWDISILHFVSSKLSLLMDDPDFQKCKSVRRCFCGGEIMPPDLPERLFAVLEASLYNSYGPTETCISSTTYEIHPGFRRQNPPIGRPNREVQVFILDGDLQPAPVGAVGELYIGGTGLARGYLNQPTLTAERFIPHPFGKPGERLYRTGDLGCYDPDGEQPTPPITFLGRIDDQVKLRGNRIELGEIESALASHPQVRRAAVLLKRGKAGDYLIAYLVLRAGEALDPQELRNQLSKKLPDYMVPATIAFLEAMPQLPSGKIDRKALAELEVQLFESQPEYCAPRTPVEQALAETFAQILGLERVGVNDNFLELGGNSLSAIRLAGQIEARLDQRLPLGAILGRPTVAGLAEMLQDCGKAAPFSETPEREQQQQAALSFGQQRLWFLERMGVGAGAYNVPAVFRLNGEFEARAFERSLNRIIERHEILRTTFIEVEGEARQAVAPELNLRLEMDDLGELPETEREPEAIRRMVEAGRAPFDLANGPLLRCILLRLDTRTHWMMLNFHHIIIDEWSLELFYKELALLYRAEIQGGNAALPELPIQFVDYAARQHEWMQTPDYQKQLAYWKAKLAGLPQRIQLRTDFPRPAEQSYRGQSVRRHFTGELLEGLRQLSKAQRVTLFTTLLAAFQALLFRYSGQADIVVGTPIANRRKIELENLIGFFLNNLVLRNNLGGGLTFRQLMRQAGANLFEAFDNQEVPFERLVEELRPQRDLGLHPLYQATFVMHKASSKELQLHGLQSRPLDLDFGWAKVDLSLILTEGQQDLDATMEYSADLFERSTIEQMLENFGVLLEGLVANPDLRVDRLPLLSKGELKRQIYEWNATASDYPNDICAHQLFEAQVERVPDSMAVIEGWRRNQPPEDEAAACQQFEIRGQRYTGLSYQALNQRANQLAHYLQKLGVKPEVRVGVCLERSLELAIAVLGALKAGGAYVPLDPDYPAQRLEYMLQDAKAPVLLTQKSLADRFEPTRMKVVCLDADWQAIAQESQGSPVCAAQPENLAYVIYTSGSTGAPKGVMISHRSLCNVMSWAQRDYPLSEADKFLLKAPISFDAAWWEFHAALMSGACLVMAKPQEHWDADYLIQTILETGTTILLAVPSLLRVLLERPRFKELSALRWLFFGGEALTPDLVERVNGCLDVRMADLYGPAEAANVTLHYMHPGAPTCQATPVGRPVANTQAYLLDNQLQPLPVGEVGEIFLGGANVGRGYLNRPALTAERFLPDPFTQAGGRLYRTGDLGRYLPDGNIEYLGRLDFQVKIRGSRVELGEIERILLQHPAVRQAAVLAQEQPGKGGVSGDQRLAAYLAARKGAQVSVQELRQYMSARLPGYMLPSTYVILDDLPISLSGKLDRLALPGLGGLLPEQEEEYLAPRTPLEETLAGIWAEALGHERVGVQDNFFELGGHSLMIMRVVARINDLFQTELGARAIFESPTIEALAAHLLAPEEQRQRIELIAKTTIELAALSEEEAQERLLGKQ